MTEHHIFARFGCLRAQIEDAFRRDGHFRSLCSDYEAAVDALILWTSREGEHGRRMSREYATLVAELEREILWELRARSDKSGAR